mgnify:FL=1
MFMSLRVHPCIFSSGNVMVGEGRKVMRYVSTPDMVGHIRVGVSSRYVVMQSPHAYFRLVISWQAKVDRSCIHLSKHGMVGHIKVQVSGRSTRVNFHQFFASTNTSIERYLGISNGWVLA